MFYKTFYLFTCLPVSGVNIGGAGSYVYDAPANNNAAPTAVDSAAKAEEKRNFAPKVAPKGWKPNDIKKKTLVFAQITSICLTKT